MIVNIEFPLKEFYKYLTQSATKQEKEQIKHMLTYGKQNNRIYSVGGLHRALGFTPTYYKEPLLYANEKYFCPNGWRRWGLDVGLCKEKFAQKYGDWPVCYHGTSRKAAAKIIQGGFLATNNSACFIKKDQKAVFSTPSIVYAGHPRYAKIQKYNNFYIQVVLQLRIDSKKIVRMPGTIQNTFTESKPVDPNYQSNRKLQWIFVWNQSRNVYPEDGMIVYGIMMRILDRNPRFEKENQWWQESRERLKWDSYEKGQDQALTL